MRVTSELWVSALMRRVFAGGGFAAILRRGAVEAGAIFIVGRGRSGDVALYGPAPQAGYAEARPEERAFMRLAAENDAEIDAKLAREARFDPDFWVLEIEPAGAPAEPLFPVTPA